MKNDISYHTPSMNGQDPRFVDLYKRFYRRVYVFMIRMRFSHQEAEDLAQDTFARVFKAMEHYRGEAEWKYIEITARRLAYNKIRGSKTIKRGGKEVPLDQQTELVDRNATLEEKVAYREKIAQLRDAIQELPASLKEPLLEQLEGRTYVEVAGKLNITVDAVKSRLRDARNRLRERFGVEIERPEDDNDQ
ncbi:MAG TPA: RNA polymerase sigma factor [Thermoanaerobaculia bacterium]